MQRSWKSYLIPVLGVLFAMASNVAFAAITISDNNLHVDRGVFYSNVTFLTASGGVAPYTFSVVASGLPGGVTVASDGRLSGVTCGSNGSFKLNVTATDSTNASANATNLTLIVNAAPAGGCALSFTSSTLPNATAGTPYSGSITATGGTSPYTYSVASGSLPSGITLNSSTGALTGTPSSAGTSTFTVLVSDSSSKTGSGTYTLTVDAAPTITVSPTTAATGAVSTAYSQTFTASGGTGPYTYAVTSGSLPADLTLSSGGILSGTPSATGNFTFTVTATDATSNTGNQSVALTINATPTITVSPATAATGTTGTAYSQTFTASGGTSPYTYAVTSGSLPAGLTLSSGGILSGTPSATGNFTFTVTATDAGSYTGSQSVALTINAAPTITVSPATAGAGTISTAYSQTFTASGGTGPYTYAVTSGSLPAGLTLSSGGTLSGTPTADGNYSFTVTATDAGSYTGSQSVALTINAAPTITIGPASLANGAVGTVYSQTLTASGGTGPYTYAVTGGSLPPGLVLSSGGVLSGTPTTGGSYSFTVTTTDANGYTSSRVMTWSTSRPDPSQDADVRGIQNTQTASLTRYIGTQITNVTRRLEDLHGYVSDFDNRLCLSVQDDANITIVAEDAPRVITLCPENNRPTDSANRISTWISGNLDHGKQQSGSANYSNRFSSKGITLGADFRQSRDLALGLALGYGFDDTDVGQHGSRVQADSLNIIGYGTWKPVNKFYLDALVGYGATTFHTQRWVDVDSIMVEGSRPASGLFASLVATTQQNIRTLDLSTYLRTDLYQLRLNDYQESNNSTQALAYDTSMFRASLVTLGTTASYPISLGIGTLTPTLRMEYQAHRNNHLSQGMHYADEPLGTHYTMLQTPANQNISAFGAGARLKISRGITTGLEYELNYHAGELVRRNLRGNLVTAF